MNDTEIRQLSPEWRNVLKTAGIKKTDLKDPETCALIWFHLANMVASDPRTSDPRFAGLALPPGAIRVLRAAGMLAEDVLR